MFDNVLGNLKAKMQEYSPIFEIQEDLDSKFEEEITASAEYVMKSLDALKFGEGGMPGLSERGALYMYHVLNYLIAEASFPDSIYIKPAEKAAIDKIVSDANVAESDPTLRRKISALLQEQYPFLKDEDPDNDDKVKQLLKGLEDKSPDNLWKTELTGPHGYDIKPDIYHGQLEPKKESNSHTFSKVDQTQKHKTWRQVNETDTSRYMD